MEGSQSVVGLLYGSSVFALVELGRLAASGNSARLPSGLVSLYAEGRYSSTPSISHPTMTYKLENYLRTYRKKSGLTQRELAFLLGCQNGAQVSRYEKRRRLPPLRTALAYEAALGVPVSQLFAGIYEEVSKEIEKRLAKLHVQLQRKKSKGSEALMNARKLRWLTGRLNSKCPDLRTKP